MGVITVNNKAAAGVNVLLFRIPDSAMINGFVTDSSGSFGFDNLDSCDYFLRTYHASYRDSLTLIPSNILSAKTPVKINLVLKGGVALKEITVSYKPPLIERKADRLVFNIESSIVGIDGDGLAVLSKTPGVRVDGAAISIIGKSSVRVMINDRLLEISGTDLFNYLKSLSADNISAIEVITSPPAKYDAQGNSGLINIRLKKNSKQGWSVRLKSSYTQATYMGISGGMDLDYKKNKLIFHTTLGLGDGSVGPVLKEFIFYPQQSLYQTDNRRDYSKFISGQTVLDYQLSGNSISGVSFTGSSGMPNIKESVNTPIYNTNNGIDSSLRTRAFTQRQTAYQSLDAYYQHKLDTLGRKISVDANYSIFSDTRNKTFSTNTFDDIGLPVVVSYKQYKNYGDQDGKIFTLKGDAELPFKIFSLSLGGNLTVINNTSDYDLYNSINGSYIIDSSQSNKFVYQENVQALYAGIDKTINKLEIQGAVRGELTETKSYSPMVHFTSNDLYFNLFPTLVISYKMNGDNSFSLNYGKRIDRPSYWDLNPFRWYFSQYAYAEGNPYLLPSYNNNLELDYIYRDFFTLSVYYSHGTNLRDRIVVVSANSDTQKNIIKNFMTSNSYGGNLTYIFNKVKWIENNDQLQLYYTQTSSSIPQTVHYIQGMNAYLSSTNLIMLNKAKTISGEIDFWYQFAGVDGVDRNNSYYNIDVGVNIRTINKKMEINAVITDILKSNSAFYYTTVNNINEESNNYYDVRRFRITFKYKFGNDKLKTIQHQASNKEETERI